MADLMVHEIVEGVEGSGGVRCGVIGEVGCSWPLTDCERKSLQAAAIAQKKTGTLQLRTYFHKYCIYTILHNYF